MSLHTTTDTMKKVIFRSAIAIGAIIVLNIVISIIKILTPHKEIPPTVAFGKLPVIVFSPEIQLVTPTYKLDTTSGLLPLFPDRMMVYKIVQPQPDLLALNNAKGLISTSEYPVPPKAISDVVYQWVSQDPLNKILTYNILTHEFTLTSSYLTDQKIIAATELGDEPGAIATGRGFLSGFNAYTEDIDATKTKTTLYSINGTTQVLQSAISLATTQLIRVDFFQKDIDKTPIYYPDPTQSLINVLVGASGTVVNAQVIHKSIIPSTNATYPIKNAQEAFLELQTASPSAHIAAIGNAQSGMVSIRTVSLGYYLGDNPNQFYLMPIIVFQGDNGFFGYVSAVTDTLIQK